MSRSSTKSLPYCGVVLAIFAALAQTPAAAGIPMTALNGSVAAVAPTPLSGVIDPRIPTVTRQTLHADELAATMDFAVSLKMRNADELRSRAQAGERISFEELAAKYEPLASDYQAVSAWLTAQGFQITFSDPSHLCVFARGTVAQIQHAMNVTLARVSVADEEYTSAITAPSVPASLAPILVGVNGLQPHIRMRKHTIINSITANSSGTPYTPAQIATAYSATPLYNEGITGANQTIAIVIDEFPKISDLKTFWSDYGISQTSSNISMIRVGSNGTTSSPTGEETLDAEWSSSMAPAAKVRIYGCGDLEESDLEEGYARVLSDILSGTVINQMSMSYGLGETYPTVFYTTSQFTTDNNYFSEISSAGTGVNQGVSIFASSGDGGSTPGLKTAGDESDPTVQVEFPASSSYVTGVGGTAPTLDSSGNESAEIVWNDSDGASGGGTSVAVSRPGWQTGAGVASGSYRLVPDLSCAASPNPGGYLVFKGKLYSTGGTSWASPTVAGFCALLNQTRLNAGKSVLGFLNSKIYPLIGTSNFRDITTVGNATANSNGNYAAGTGYDEASGIGVPLVSTLAQTLLGPVITSPPTPQIATTEQSVTFSVSATGTGTLSYQWEQDGTAISGATSSSYTIPSITGTSTGNYSVVVTDAESSNSASAPLIVLSSAPMPQTVYSGSTATFAATVSDSNLSYSYQWYFNGSAIQGATGASYSIPDATSANAGSYSVAITDTTDMTASVMTSAVTLTVNPAPPGPATDTPTMPEWAAIALAVMLLLTAAPKRLQYRRR